MDSKEKMSKALGTAFLSHQVAQLEQDILKGSNTSHQAKGNPRGRGNGRGGRGASRGTPRINANPRPQVGTPARFDDGQGGNKRVDGDWRSSRKTNQQRSPGKIADRIVVDASVLIHALGTVREWCQESNKEVIIIPLEALNTLDLLKKGSSRTAIQARHASRLLEAQVGTNPRILVQQDRGYIPWEEVFSETAGNRLSTASASTTSSSEDKSVRPPSEISRNPPGDISLTAAKRTGEPPEWLKRTVCCAKFEQQRPRDVLDSQDSNDPVKTVLAISCMPNGHRELQDNRFSERAAGSVTRQWGVNAGLQVLDVEMEYHGEDSRVKQIQRGSRFKRIDDSDNEAGANEGTELEGPLPEMIPWGDDVTTNNSTPLNGTRGVYQSGTHNRNPSAENSLPAKPRAVEPPSPRRSAYDSPRGGYRGRRPSGNMVEKPSAPVTLTNAGFLPAGKTIRLLARGEKLEP